MNKYYEIKCCGPMRNAQYADFIWCDKQIPKFTEAHHSFQSLYYCPFCGEEIRPRLIIETKPRLIIETKVLS